MLSVELIGMVKNTKREIVITLIDALVSFIFWTVALTPYVWFYVVKQDLDGYIKWVGMQLILVPPLGAVFSRLIVYLKGRYDPFVDQMFS